MGLRISGRVNSTLRIMGITSRSVIRTVSGISPAASRPVRVRSQGGIFQSKVPAQTKP